MHLASLWPWHLTSNLQNISSNGHSHDDYLWQMSLKSLHLGLVHRNRVTRNGSRCYWTTAGRTDGWTADNPTTRCSPTTVVDGKWKWNGFKNVGPYSKRFPNKVFYRAALNAGWSSREKCVCPSDKRVNWQKKEEKSVQNFTPYERSFSLVFWEEEWLVGATLTSWNFGLTGPRWREIADFEPIIARSTSAVTPSEKKFN